MFTILNSELHKLHNDYNIRASLIIVTYIFVGSFSMVAVFNLGTHLNKMQDIYFVTAAVCFSETICSEESYNLNNL